MDRDQQIQELININFSFEPVRVDGKGATHYTITLETSKGSREFEFFQGSGIKEDPSLVSVLYCLISDVSAADISSAKEFQLEFGYEHLSKAREVHTACKVNKRKIKELGILKHYEALQEIFQDY